MSAPPGSVEAALASLTRAQAEALAPEAEPNALRAVATQLADALHRPDSSPLTEHRDFLTIALRTAYELNNRREFDAVLALEPLLEASDREIGRASCRERV